MSESKDHWGWSVLMTTEYVEEQRRKNESYRRVMDAMATKAQKSGLLHPENSLTDADNSGKIAPA